MLDIVMYLPFYLANTSEEYKMPRLYELCVFSTENSLSTFLPIVYRFSCNIF